MIKMRTLFLLFSLFSLSNLNLAISEVGSGSTFETKGYEAPANGFGFLPSGGLEILKSVDPSGLFYKDWSDERGELFYALNSLKVFSMEHLDDYFRKAQPVTESNFYKLLGFSDFIEKMAKENKKNDLLMRHRLNSLELELACERIDGSWRESPYPWSVFAHASGYGPAYFVGEHSFSIDLSLNDQPRLEEFLDPLEYPLPSPSRKRCDTQNRELQGSICIWNSTIRGGGEYTVEDVESYGKGRLVERLRNTNDQPWNSSVVNIFSVDSAGNLLVKDLKRKDYDDYGEYWICPGETAVWKLSLSPHLKEDEL